MNFFKTAAFVAALSIFAPTALFSQASPEVEVENQKSVTVKVKGVTCSKDLKTISDNVEKLDGVSSCKAKKPGPTTTFLVTYNPEIVTEEQIHAAITGTGGCENPDERPYKIKD